MTRRPNILIFMVDQLNGHALPRRPGAVAACAQSAPRWPSARSRFANGYTASPLCAPARASFMSGQLPRRTRVYDNAAEFASDIPTYAHHLRRAGYQTCLSGKMHFVGPDQLHGFEERLTTDIYPADFGWTPDYRKPGERIDWWYHNMGSVTGAGVAEITNQLEYDDEVAYHAVRKVYDLGRGQDARPWMLTVSFTHPHDPYRGAAQILGSLRGLRASRARRSPRSPTSGQDPHSQRHPRCQRLAQFRDHRRRTSAARAAPISPTSPISTTRSARCWPRSTRSGRRENTIIVFLSDHGDMLGERGLWFKMNFFEGSARVPLMIAAPDLPPGRVDAPVSTLDVLPTLADLAGIDLGESRPGPTARRWSGSASRGRASRPSAWNTPPKAPTRRWSRCARAGGNTSTASSTRRCCSTSTPTRMS